MNSTECLICYEKIKNNNFCITECNHVYCLTCMIKTVLRKVECPYCKYKLVEITEEEQEIDENIIQEVNVQIFNNIAFSENDDADSNYEGEEGVRTTRLSYNLRSGPRQIPSMYQRQRIPVQTLPRFIEVPNSNFIAVRVIRRKNKKNKKNKKSIEKFFLEKAINEIKLIEYNLKSNLNKKNKKDKINKNRSFKF